MPIHSFTINRWDIISNGEINASGYPIIYFKPSLDFLEIAARTRYIVPCRVRETGIQLYDTSDFMCIIQKSSNLPNSRPNFFKETGWYVGILLTALNPLYPYNNGVVDFLPR